MRSKQSTGTTKKVTASNDRKVTQAEKFAAAAREYATDQDEEAFKGVLQKVGNAPPVPINTQKKRRDPKTWD